MGIKLRIHLFWQLRNTSLKPELNSYTSLPQTRMSYACNRKSVIIVVWAGKCSRSCIWICVQIDEFHLGFAVNVKACSSVWLPLSYSFELNPVMLTLVTDSEVWGQNFSRFSASPKYHPAYRFHSTISYENLELVYFKVFKSTLCSSK